VKLHTHFPWQRLVMTILFDVTMYLTCRQYVDWLYYFATLDPTRTSAATAITALSAGMGVLFVCFAAVQIWFITGSTKTVEAMFKFNAATAAATNMISQAVQENRHEEIDQTLREFCSPELTERYGDR
jgi:hypothetical protein